MYWSDLAEAGKKVPAATGKPIITSEISDAWSYYIMLAQQKSDLVDSDNNSIVDNQISADTLQFMTDMINTRTALGFDPLRMDIRDSLDMLFAGAVISLIPVMLFPFQPKVICCRPDCRQHQRIALNGSKCRKRKPKDCII